MRRLALLALAALLATAAYAGAEISQQGRIRVNFDGGIRPRALPRSKPAPIKIDLSARISSTDGKTPPQLRGITIGINRNGRLDSAGLPICALDQIQPATNADALAACRRSLVGQGSFAARVLIPGQTPFPSGGKVYAFNSRLHGHPGILVHVYGNQPVPTSYTLPFRLTTTSRGTYGTVLDTTLPHFAADAGYVTGLSLTLGRTFSHHGRRHSYVSASCPAPKGFRSVPFPFARARFSFAGSHSVTSVLSRSCRARG
jgi:hypothetical protein